MRDEKFRFTSGGDDLTIPATMTWINFLWPVVTGACLTLALINLRIAFTEPPRAARLLFSISAFCVAFVSVMELSLMRAQSAARYETLLPWGDLATWATMSSLTAFVWVFFGTGNKWLAITGSALYGGGLFLYFGPDSGLLYLKITGVKAVETYGGATYQVAEGVPNPWGLLAYAGVLLMLAFAIDASVGLWHRGNRRRAVIVGGTLVFFILAAGVQSALIERGVIRTPYLISWCYLTVLIAMGHELTRDVFAATELAAQLRESQERMTLAAKAAELGLWVWDIKRDAIWTTDKGREMFGFPQAGPINFALFEERLHPDDRAPVAAAVAEAMANGGDYYSEHRVLTGTVPLRWIAARGRIEFTSDHRPLRMRGVSIDITSRKNAETELQERRGELAHLSRVTMLGELSGSLAHELNQPLTAILSNAQAAQRYLSLDPPDLGELREILADIVSEDERAGEVIRRLRLLFKKGEVQQQALDANELVLDVLKLMRGDLANHGITIVTELAPDLPSVHGDRVQLQQVLLNLVMNACDAMAENQPDDRCLTLRTAARADTGLRIEVSDQGRGLPDGDPERVFERYYTTKALGLGLGLSVCRTIIAAHGGTLNAVAHAERGATFICTLGGPATS